MECVHSVHETWIGPMPYINERFAADQRIPQKGMTKCTLGLIKLEGIPPV